MSVDLVDSKSIEIATVISGFRSCFAFNPPDQLIRRTILYFVLPHLYIPMTLSIDSFAFGSKHIMSRAIELFTFLEFSIYIIDTKLGHTLMHCITIYQFVAAWSVCTRSVFASPFLVYQFKPNYTIFFPIACMDTRLVCSLICAHNRLAHDTIFNFVYRRRWQEWNALLVRYFSHQIAKKIDRAEAAWRENSTITKKFHLSGESQSERKRYACVKRVGTLCKTHTHSIMAKTESRQIWFSFSATLFSTLHQLYDHFYAIARLHVSAYPKRFYAGSILNRREQLCLDLHSLEPP